MAKVTFEFDSGVSQSFPRIEKAESYLADALVNELCDRTRVLIAGKDAKITISVKITEVKKPRKK